MAKIIPSLRRLVSYLIVTLILTIAALYIFDKFIELTPVVFSQIVEEASRITIILAFSLAAIEIIRRFRPFLSQRMGTRVSGIIWYAMLAIVLLFAAFGISAVVGVHSSDLLTSAGIISITAGLVVSTFVGSMLSGFFVFSTYKFKVGDDVMVNNIPGKVIEMSAFVMRIQTDVGQITIPNSAVASGGIIITVIDEKVPMKDTRLHFGVGDRVLTPYNNEMGTVKEITAFNTAILLDSGKEIIYMNNSIASGGVALAKVIKPSG